MEQLQSRGFKGDKTGVRGTKKVLANCLQLFQHFTSGCLLFLDIAFVHSDHTCDFAQL